jgi:hypothetical protein
LLFNAVEPLINQRQHARRVDSALLICFQPFGTSLVANARDTGAFMASERVA